MTWSERPWRQLLGGGGRESPIPFQELDVRESDYEKIADKVESASAVGARVNRTTNQSLTNQTYTAISFDGERFDSDAFHSTSTNPTRVTIPRGLQGRYIITANVDFAANATGYREVRLRLNGITDIAVTNLPNVGASTSVAFTIATIFELFESDYIELFCYQNSGGALNVLTDNAWSPELSLARIGSGAAARIVKGFSPDANPESTSVDGQVSYDGGVSETFAIVRAGSGAGSKAANDTSNTLTVGISCSTTLDQFEQIIRSILVFDTSAIPAGATIISARLRLVGSSKLDQLLPAPTIVVVASTPAANTSLAAGDYDNLGTAALSGTVALSSLDVSGTVYTNFTLNVTGLAAITKAGITKLGIRFSADADNTPPTWESGQDSSASFKSADHAEAALYKPILEVTYQV